MAIALVAGACAGILGFTGVWGLVLFLVGNVLGDLFLSSIATAGNAEKFLPVAGRDFFTFGSLTTGSLSFILTWLIFYNVLFVF